MEHYLKIADMVAGRETDSMKTVVGSCIGLCLWDSKRHIGAMVHIMMPEKENDKEAPAGKYADTAIPELIKILCNSGAQLKDTVAKLSGGASMFGTASIPKGNTSIGLKNHDAVRKHLEKAGIPIVFEDIGGTAGRNILFDCSTGEVIIKDHTGKIKRG